MRGDIQPASVGLYFETFPGKQIGRLAAHARRASFGFARSGRWFIEMHWPSRIFPIWPKPLFQLLIKGAPVLTPNAVD
jgi:hypothetical protein